MPLTLLNFQSHLQQIITLSPCKNLFQSLALKLYNIPLLERHCLLLLMSHYPGAKSSLINLLILRSFLHPWKRGTITTMIQRILVPAMIWLRRSKLSLNRSYGLNLTGLVSLTPGQQGPSSSSIIAILNCVLTVPLLWNFSVLLQMSCSWLLSMMLKSVIKTFLFGQPRPAQFFSPCTSLLWFFIFHNFLFFHYWNNCRQGD